MKLANQMLHTVLLDPLQKSEVVVVDCGSNRGEFAKWAADGLGAEVYGYEPDPRLFPQLPKIARVQYFQKAVAGSTGTARLHLGEGQCSSLRYEESESSPAEQVATTTLDEEFAKLGLQRIDLLKLDVEGAEIEILLNAPAETLQRVVQATVEFHDFMRSEDVPEIRRCIARMRSLGFEVLYFSTRTYGDVLFVNRKFVSLSFIERCLILWQGKYLPGMKRNLSRLIHRN
jgi:FkbM family methyltransferase